LAAAFAWAFIARVWALTWRLDIAGREALLRTPPAYIAQLMQNGGFFGPKAYTRQLLHHEWPHRRHRATPISCGCFEQLSNMIPPGPRGWGARRSST
jgi:hypothetical protein